MMNFYGMRVSPASIFQARKRPAVRRTALSLLAVNFKIRKYIKWGGGARSIKMCTLNYLLEMQEQYIRRLKLGMQAALLCVGLSKQVMHMKNGIDIEQTNPHNLSGKEDG